MSMGVVGADIINNLIILSFTYEPHKETSITLNLTDGKPATEKDAEEFIRLVEGGV